MTATPDSAGASPLRIFLGAFGQPGHVFPMLALGTALARRGHHVTYETWERWRPDVEAAGMDFVPAPEFPVFPTATTPLKPYEAVLRATPATRRRIIEARPDVVVHDILTLAPALAAELEQIPTATLVPHLYPPSAPGHPPFSIGARPPRSALGRAFWRGLTPAMEKGLIYGMAELNQTRAALGLGATARLHGGLSEQLTLVATLPQLEYQREWPENVHVVGPLMWEPAADPVDPPPGQEPLVLIAPSTAQDPGQAMLQAGLAGLCDADVRVLATTNRRPSPVPLTVGAGSKLVNWLSYSQTMPQADVIVCHAGHGTLVRALACGVPVLAVPHSGDMAENAARLDWSGAGLRLPWRLVKPFAIRSAVHELLCEDRYRDRARQIAAWPGMDQGPVRAAELIEQLAARQAVRAI